MTALPSFQIRVPGKWVLVGEHSVLRGVEAITLPIAPPCDSFALTLTYTPGLEPFRILPIEADPHVRPLIEKLAVEAKTGVLTIESRIPPGAGLGSSAALCVAFVRWAEYMRHGSGFLPELSWVTAEATRLEDHFHGKSSGMDVAAVSYGEPIVFSRAGGARPLGLSRLPRFTLHDTSLRASTRACVEKVRRLVAEQPAQAAAIDERMQIARNMAEKGLRAYFRSEAEGLKAVAGAMELARGCFEEWGLIPPEVSALMARLREEGALACKPTGAGGGGFVVALWP